MRKIIFIFLTLLSLNFSAPRVSTLHDLPEHMQSYKNYIVVMVHGMGSNAEIWDDLKSRLSEVVGDADFAGHIFAYTMDDPYAAYYGNAEELSGWLKRARQEFMANNPDYSKVPQKFILLTHSMGSLAARSYIYSDTLAASGVDPENFAQGFYQNDVKKVVFIAPTHKGSSMADFLIHYMASDNGYKFGSPSLLTQLISFTGVKMENFGRYAQNRNSLLTPKENIPVINEIPFTEDILKKYLIDLVRADFEESNADRERDREILARELRESLKDRLFEYANVRTEAGQAAPFLSGDWFAEQMNAGLVIALEELANAIVAAYREARRPIDSLDDFIVYLNDVSLQQIWDKEADRINAKMQAEGFSFYYQIKVDKNWPSNYVPSIKLTYKNWNSISLDWDSMLDEFRNVLLEYRFSVKLTNDIDYVTSLEDLNNKAQMLTELYSPLPRLVQVIAELDTAPLFSFPSAKVLLEVNNYCAADVMKELLDFILVNFFQKKTLEGGAVTSLMSTDPVTAVLNSADLPQIYDPVEYRNVIGRGSIAFDRKHTEQFNRFFYGDLPALNGLLKDTQVGGIFSALAANAYQIKLMSSAEYQKLPSGEARFGALALSYARGLFTKEGDGAVDIDSLTAKNVSALSGAQNYFREFETPALSNYVDSGFIEDTVKAEVACALVELSFNLFGGTTPPLVRGTIRLTPLFNFIALAVNYKEDLIRDFNAHNSIMQSENSLGLIQESLYDNPLLVLNNVYMVSGNASIPLAPDALQEKTAAGQEDTSVPLRKMDNRFYLPMAYNVKSPKIKLEAQLYDFAPQLAKVEYSLNFAPFVTVSADKWGAVDLPEFSVAEGQNIIMFRLTNRVGRKTEQYLRIIRSSTPLLVSEILPAPQSAVATDNILLNAVFYNAQFISNNIEVSNLEAVIIDGEKLPPAQYKLTRGSNHEYQNYLKLEAPLHLSEGRHTVTLQAKDTYSHFNETHWFFDVDLTPPEIILQDIQPVSANQAIEINYELSDGENSALQDLQIILRTQDKILWTQTYPLVGIGAHRENISSLNLTDGKYFLDIAVSDMAGNRTIISGNVPVDSVSPRAKLLFDKYLNQKIPQTVFTVFADEEISGQIILKTSNLGIVLNLIKVTANNYIVTLDNQNIPDATYSVQMQLQDLAGNQIFSEHGELLVNTKGPLISGLHAEPVILNKNNPVPYNTQILASISDDSAGEIKAQAIFIHKATGLEMQRMEMTENSGVFSANFSAADARYLSGAYMVRIIAEDIFGNQTLGGCEIIKDGIVPEISGPANGAEIGGIALITGKVSDSDWVNSQDFESYEVYWAEGLQILPADLRNLDLQIWRAERIEVPYLNRNNAAQKNISYRQVPDNSLLCWWDTQGLSRGAYTILLISSEKNLGATAGLARHVFVRDDLEYKLSARILQDFPVMANEAGITFNVLNNGSTANISAEIVDKYGKVVKHYFYPQVGGVLYTGAPQEFSDGAYLWQDDKDAKWHLRLISPENCTYNILLGGVSEIISANISYTLNSGILQMNGYLMSDESREIVFDLQKNVGNFYINAEKSADAVWLRIGAGAHIPPANSYAQSLTNTSGVLSLFWDGRLASGAYAENGEYTLQLLGSGLDGGIYRENITFNIATSLVVSNLGYAPQDGLFEAMGEINKITLGYAVNKDIYLRAEIIDRAGVTISILPEQKILASDKPAYLSWNGSYPNFDSKQKLLNGTYRAVLYFRTADNQQATLNYTNIQIQNNSSGDLARLEKLGETVIFNGSPVQAVAGSSDYYWSARGEGIYTVPKSFSYELETKGNQIVTAAPFVPFAGLYHRGFDKVQIKVNVNYEWDLDSKKSGKQIKKYSDEHLFEFTPGQQETSWTGSRSGENHEGGWQGHETRFFTITVTDIAGTVMYKSEKINVIGMPNSCSVLACNGAFRIDVNASLSRSNDGSYSYHQATITVKLMDDVKYSRLTNRYYAWFGYVNKYYPLEFQFTEMQNDLGKLGFVPSTYFLSGVNSATLNSLIQEPYPQALNTGFITQNQNIIEALQKLNVTYESIPYQDDSYYNYLADEYFEFIPMTVGQISFVTENRTGTGNIITNATIYSDYTITANIPWPTTEEYIAGEDEKAVNLIEKLAAEQEITLVNYAELPFVFDKQSINFGGLGANRLLMPAVLGKKGLYQKNLSDIAADLPKSVVRDSSLEFSFLQMPQDLEISFDNGLRRANYSPSASVTARYLNGLNSDVFNWSTEQDFFLKNGVIDSPPLIFNEYAYAPVSGRLPIYEAYFATVNRRADLPSQNIAPIDYYTFLEHDYYNPDSGYILNPNLDFTRWTIQVYDQTGQPNQDLSVSDLRLSNTDILQNNLQIKLNLDAVEKRYVEIYGAALGDYELLYFDGENWQSICTGNAMEGRLGWWDVTQLNGSHTVTLKVSGENGEYSLAKQDVYVGKLLRNGDNNETNKRVSSPYRRAEVYFHPQSYKEDKFITVSPVKLQDLRLQNQPELYALGPIAEILPHGSEFPDADKRPTVVFRYSHDDLAELHARGIDTDKMGLYYINESGELEAANSERHDTEYGLEIWTVLSHFSPYTILSGEVPMLPTFNIALSGLNERNLKIFGKAQPNSVLEISLDDDEYFGDSDGVEIIRNIISTDNVSAWVFDRRNWNEDYADKLTAEQKNQIQSGRQLLQEMYLEALAENYALEKEYVRQYILGNEDLRLELIAPTLNNFLPENLEIILQEYFPIILGQTAKTFTVTTDESGYFNYAVPIDMPTASVFVTYVLTGNIQNRPIARKDFVEDLNAPQFLQIEQSSPYANQQNPAVTVNIGLSKEAKLIVSCYDSQGELLDIQYQNIFLAQHILKLEPALEDEYYYVIQAIDPAGNQSQSYGLALLADFTPPRLSDFILPGHINPDKNQLSAMISTNEKVATFSLQVPDLLEEIGYTYLLTAKDTAENTAVFECAVTVDKTSPELSDFNFGDQAAQGVRVFWPEQENCRYVLTAQKLNSENIIAYNIGENYYYDEQVSPNCFYEYTLQAVDMAGNESAIVRRLVYTADDNLQTYLTDSTLNYKDFSANLSQVKEDVLYVVQRLGQSSETLQPGTIQLTTIYRFINSKEEKTAPLEITLAFNPQILAEQYIRPDTLTAMRYDDDWTAEDVEVLTINYQDNTLTFRANSYGDYALFGKQEYWVYAKNPASLRFAGLRDEDFLDIAVTINADARDQATAINTQNMWLMLDNNYYPLLPESFLADPASFGRSGRISFNLQKILQRNLADGEHILDLYVLNEAGHTANATLKFTTIQNFQIENILPAPNPFGADGMFFTYQLSKPAESIEIRIYDVNGRLLRTLDNCSNQAGYNKTKWDGRNNRNSFVANDVYFYVIRIEADGRKKNIKGKIAALR